MNKPRNNIVRYMNSVNKNAVHKNNKRETKISPLQTYYSLFIFKEDIQLTIDNTVV